MKYSNVDNSCTNCREKKSLRTKTWRSRGDDSGNKLGKEHRYIIEDASPLSQKLLLSLRSLRQKRGSGVIGLHRKYSVLVFLGMFLVAIVLIGFAAETFIQVTKVDRARHG